MPTRLATKGDMTSRGVLSVVFKIPKCTSHLGIGLESSQQGQMDGQVVDRRLRGGQEGPRFLRIQASGWRRAGGCRGHPVRGGALQKFPINGDFQGPV